MIDWSHYVLSATSSFFAVFLGAYFAFKFQSRAKSKEKKDEAIQAAQEAIFYLIRMANMIGGLLQQSINPYRNQRLKYLNIPPILDLQEEFPIPWNKLIFLLGSPYAKTLLDLSVFESSFRLLVQLVNKRSSLHLNVIQPRMVAAGIREGDYSMSEGDVERVIGHDNRVVLMRLTDDIVGSADAVLSDAGRLLNDLRLAMNEMYPDAEFPEARINL